MATSTSKLGLTKPALTDNVDVTVLNTNFDEIDTAAGFSIVTSTTRPASPWAGQAIFETDTELSFVWDGTAWQEAGGSGGATGAEGAINLNLNTIGEDYTFDTGYNGVSAGPITIATGATVTVPSGSAWSIV